MMTKIPVDPKLGDMLCSALEQIHDVDVDIILIVMPRLTSGKQELNPTFVTSLHPDVMEAVVTQLGEQIADSKGGKRTITGRHTREV